MSISQIIARSIKSGLGLTAALSLSGCLLTSPYWNQVFNYHTDQVPIQAWTTSSTASVTFECSKAGHSGLYPTFSNQWFHVATVTPDLPGVLDPAGSRVYSVNHKAVLPANCWRRDPANNLWYSAVRATSGSTEYATFNADGLECLGRENGAAASWFGWLGKGCELTYSSGNRVPYVIFRANN